MRIFAFVLALVAAPLLSAALRASPADLRSIAGMRDHNRVLLVFSPSLRDPRLEMQRKIFARFSLGAAERDLIFVQVAEGKVIGAHDQDAGLRRKFDTAADRYRTLLIGKDGHIAIDEPGPIDEARLSAAIDAMPMRQTEMQKAREGHPLPKNN